jgi:SAM-dependent methyltransferase
MQYFYWFTELVTARMKKNSSKTVLEIACNDGSLLNIFKENGWDVLGVDPALNLRPMTEAKGLEVIADYWDEKTAGRIDRKFSVIVAQNVLAHLPYPMEFLEQCKSVLDKDGIIYIQTSQANMVDNLEFDTVYHEHHSFFSANSMRTLAERVGLKVIDVQHVPVHGTSYLFSLAVATEHSKSLEELIQQEQKSGRYDINTYINFQDNVQKNTNNFLEKIRDYRRNGFKIVGYGAAAKGSTFLSYSSLKVDYIVDDNPMKWGLFTPDGTVEIRDPVVLNNEKDNLIIVVFAWNFFDEIVSRIDGLRNTDAQSNNVVYVTYFPEFRYIDGK